MIFYSPSTGGFYHHQENDFIPTDVVEISDATHRHLLEGFATGMRVVPGPEGFPVLAAPLPLPQALLCENERSWRSVQLNTTDGLISRHRDELEEGTNTTLTAERYNELQAYRRALRHWPEAKDFPLVEHRPPVPSWLAEHLR